MEGGDPLYKKVGAVLVLPNDMCYAIDCSRNGVHAVARLIMAHPNIPENCKVFLSRKPCSFCTKLLVQAQVERVFYLPIEPEYFPMKERREEAERRGKCFKSETSCVDNLFKVSPIGQTIFVPEVPKAVVKSVPKKFETPEAIRGNMKSILQKMYWDRSSSFNEKEDLPWPSFDDDKDMKAKVNQQFDNLIEWMGTFCVAQEKGYSFELKGKRRVNKNSFNPTEEKQSKQANHLMTLAKILAMRTDDPTTGVGAVIVNKKMEIVGLGWNGFPKKARYGEFARASHKDKGVQDKKYPYSIHAEQNALMMRNTKNVEGGTLFVTKTPCDECTPLLEMQEITTVVLGEEIQDRARQGIRYTGFHEGRKFTCFLMKWNVDGPERN
ncbi:PREDICTED: cytidine and dCMP deaminase domain-containing protein 1-like [Acropora digitifera]|uniref:cytidine and dCMP deaminase domain-containing protein 1-like n=1 Tax=Acropora digitifera TaxID=70779 RepID=UPI00077A6E99|nr:PREDICTED: cytidine and dCMP deaminase domain-containing protein 1-like [Acropora digitifera]